MMVQGTSSDIEVIKLLRMSYSPKCISVLWLVVRPNEIKALYYYQKMCLRPSHFLIHLFNVGLRNRYFALLCRKITREWISSLIMPRRLRILPGHIFCQCWTVKTFSLFTWWVKLKAKGYCCLHHRLMTANLNLTFHWMLSLPRTHVILTLLIIVQKLTSHMGIHSKLQYKMFTSGVKKSFFDTIYCRLPGITSVAG